MADEKKKDDLPEPVSCGNVKAYHRALAKAVRIGKKVMTTTEDPDALATLTEHVGGAEKALSVLRKSHAKRYKSHPMDDDEIIAKAFDDEDAEEAARAEAEAEAGKKPGEAPAPASATTPELEIEDEEVKKALELLDADNERLDALILKAG